MTNDHIDSHKQPAQEVRQVRDTAEKALWVATGDLYHTSRQVYLESLEQALFAHPPSALVNHRIDMLSQKPSRASNLQTVQKLLKTPIAQEIAFIFWKESEWLSAEAVSRAGLEKAFGSVRVLNKNSLASFISDASQSSTSDDAKGMNRTVSRVYDAMHVYDLAEVDPLLSNKRVIALRGTEKLHNFMSYTYQRMSNLFARQFRSPGSRNVIGSEN